MNEVCRNIIRILRCSRHVKSLLKTVPGPGIQANLVFNGPLWPMILSTNQIAKLSVLMTVLVTEVQFVNNEPDHTSFGHTKIYRREILIIISGRFLKTMIENKFLKNFKYLKMNRLNIYSYPTKIQPRSVNTLSITAILTAQDSIFQQF